MPSAVKVVGSAMVTISMALVLLNSYLLYSLLNVPTTIWVIFWVYLALLISGMVVSSLGGD